MPMLQEEGHYGTSVPHIGNLPWIIHSIGISSDPRIVDSTSSVFVSILGVGRGGESPSSVRLVQSRSVQPTDDRST